VSDHALKWTGTQVISAILRISSQFVGIYEFRISFHFVGISEVFRIYSPLDEVLSSLKRSSIILLHHHLLSFQTTYLRDFLFDLSLYYLHAYIFLLFLNFYALTTPDYTSNPHHFPVNVWQNCA